jgi:hypothetical protein
MDDETFTGRVILIDETGAEQEAHVELAAGPDPRIPTLDTWHGQITNGCDPRWLALSNFTLRFRFPDGREGTALVDRNGAVVGVSYPPFGMTHVGRDVPGTPDNQIVLHAIEHGETTIVIDRAEYEDAKRTHTLDLLLDAQLSDIDSSTVVYEPDGTKVDPYA